MKRQLTLTATLLATMAACGDDSATLTEPGSSRNVATGGAQDIGEFRALVAAGEVPSSDTLDDVGFFAEHALDLPAADCGDSVCVHPMLAVAPRFDGGNWTMAFAAMNSPIAPAALPRPNAHVIAVIDENVAMPQQVVETALKALYRGLQPDDRVSLVSYDARVRVFSASVAPDNPVLLAQTEQIWGGSSDRGAAMYDAIAAAGLLADERFDGVHRMILLTSGQADVGITDPDRIVALAKSLAERGVAINVIGSALASRDASSRSIDAMDVPLRIGELGAGTYEFAGAQDDLQTMLANHAATTLFPLGTRFELAIEAARGYRVGRVYGASRAHVNDKGATIELPALYLGHRNGARDVSRGRRGGGGGLFVELIADPALGIAAGKAAFTAKWQYVDSSTTTPRTVDEQTVVTNVLPAGSNPDGMWPSFSDPERGKAFMMLNMYLALKAVVELYDAGDCARALGVIDMMAPSIEGWQGRYTDPDIRADEALLFDLGRNVEQKCGSVTPVPAVGFGGGCMML